MNAVVCCLCPRCLGGVFYTDLAQYALDHPEAFRVSYHSNHNDTTVWYYKPQLTG